MKTALLLAALVGLATMWLFERNTAAQLHSQIDAQRESQQEIARLRRERERLRARQPSDSELERLRLAALEKPRSQNVPAVQDTIRTQSRKELPIGEWTPAREWQNRGTATPHAVVETALWAAAGGDVTALKNLLALTEATRAKAEAVIAHLPENSPWRHASPEDLIAMFAIKSIPVGEAQLVWFTENGRDDATACVFLKNPSTAEGSVARVVETSATGGEAREMQLPPQLPGDGKTAATYLALHRDGASWRLVVPPNAVDKIAKELASVTVR